MGGLLVFVGHGTDEKRVYPLRKGVQHHGECVGHVANNPIVHLANLEVEASEEILPVYHSGLPSLHQYQRQLAYVRDVHNEGNRRKRGLAADGLNRLVCQHLEDAAQHLDPYWRRKLAVDTQVVADAVELEAGNHHSADPGHVLARLV